MHWLCLLERWAADPNPPDALNLLDRQTLSDPYYWGQSYIIRTPDATSMWAIGSPEQGVLLAAMTILQAIRSHSGGVEIQGLYARDYPHFEFSRRRRRRPG